MTAVPPGRAEGSGPAPGPVPQPGSAGPQQVAFEYAVLRVVPRADRGEFVNVAVVLYCQGLDFLRCASELDTTRLTSLAPDIDLDAVAAALHGICAVCDGDLSAGPAGTQARRARFGWLTAPRSTVVQAGPVHPGLTSDPEAELVRLLARFVRL